MLKIWPKKRKHANRGEINPEDILMDASNVPNFNQQKMEGVMIRSLNKGIIYFIGSTFACILLFYMYQLYSMQIVNNSHYQMLAERNKIRSVPIFPKRGAITDRNGVLLAWNNVSTDTELIKREYISTNGYSNLLGYISYPKIDKSGVFWQNEYLGKDGLEKIYQPQLSGQIGSHIYEVSATGEPVPGKVTVKGVDGLELKTNIDSKLQSKMYEYIEKLATEKGFHGGAGVIMNVNTGEVVTMTSYPEYDNNIMTNYKSDEEKKLIGSWLNDKDNKFSNRAISGLYTPGSTVKPFMAYSALTEGVIDPSKSILSTGKLVIKNPYGGEDTIFKDWKVHGYVDMRHAISVSSDEYFYQIGGGYKDQPGLGIDNIYKYMSYFGFASSTGIDLPSEKKGVIPNRQWKEKMYEDGDWKLGDTYHTAIGQYGFQTTPIELIRSVSAIANGKYLPTPRVYGVATTSTYIDIDTDNLQVIRDGMRLAVTDSNDGTVRSLHVAGVDVAAKSGTAELGVKRDRVNSWVMGYYPYDKPKYAFVVLMENGDVHNLIGASSVMRNMLNYIVDNKSDFEYMFN